MPNTFEPVAGLVWLKDLDKSSPPNVLVYTDGNNDGLSDMVPCLIVPAIPTEKMVERARQKIRAMVASGLIADHDIRAILTAALAPEGV